MGWVQDEHAAGSQSWACVGAVGLPNCFCCFDAERCVQPRLSCLRGDGSELFRQSMGFRPGNDWVPDQVSAGRKSMDALLYAGAHFDVIAFDFIAWVDQHHRSL